MLKGRLTAAICAAMMLFLANTTQWTCLASDDTDISPSSYYRSQTQQQKESHQVDITGTLKHSSFGYGNWDLEASNHQVFRIQNSQPWDEEPWFKAEAIIRITGNLRPDIKQPDAHKATLVAEHIYQSQVKNPDNSIPGQIESQMTPENATKYAKKVPFIKRMLNKIGI